MNLIKVGHLAADLVEVVQVWEVAPGEVLVALHGQGDLHESGQVTKVEVLHTGNLPLAHQLLGSFHVLPQISLSLSVPGLCSKNTYKNSIVIPEGHALLWAHPGHHHGGLQGEVQG